MLKKSGVKIQYRYPNKYNEKMLQMNCCMGLMWRFTYRTKALKIHGRYRRSARKRGKKER